MKISWQMMTTMKKIIKKFMIKMEMKMVKMDSNIKSMFMKKKKMFSLIAKPKLMMLKIRKYQKKRVQMNLLRVINK